MDILIQMCTILIGGFQRSICRRYATRLYVIGSHDLTLDTRWCRLESQYIPFTPQVHCYPNITARWNLTCIISAAYLGYASVEVWHLISLDDGNNLCDSLVFNLTSSGSEHEFNEIQETSAISEYRCSSTRKYLISVVLRVTLSGISSVQGLESGTPLSLIVENISTSEGV